MAHHQMMMTEKVHTMF